MQYGAGSAVVITGSQPSFLTDVYLSGTTFFTLGLGDVIPRSSLARALVVTEAGFGFGFLAAVIGYLPFIYGSFSKREVNISLLDSRAGTPPTAGELLRRHSYAHGQDALCVLLKDWELWCAELMESHLSYPVLAYFRSQRFSTHARLSSLVSRALVKNRLNLLLRLRVTPSSIFHKYSARRPNRCRTTGCPSRICAKSAISSLSTG
jgi:hypothetical protein